MRAVNWEGEVQEPERRVSVRGRARRVVRKEESRGGVRWTSPGEGEGERLRMSG